MTDEIASRDDNYNPTITGISSVDEETVLKVYVNPDIEGDGTGTHGVILKISG